MPGEVCQLCLSLIVRVWLWDPLPFWTISLNTFTLTYVGRPLFYLLSIPGRPRKSSEVGGGGPGPGLPTGTPDRFVLSFYLEKKTKQTPIYMNLQLYVWQTFKAHSKLTWSRNGRARSRGAGGVSQSQPGSRWVLEISVHLFQKCHHGHVKKLYFTPKPKWCIVKPGPPPHPPSSPTTPTSTTPTSTARPLLSPRARLELTPWNFQLCWWFVLAWLYPYCKGKI